MKGATLVQRPQFQKQPNNGNKANDMNTKPMKMLWPGGVRLFPLVAVLHVVRNSTACSKKQYDIKMNGSETMKHTIRIARSIVSMWPNPQKLPAASQLRKSEDGSDADESPLSMNRSAGLRHGSFQTGGQWAVPEAGAPSCSGAL
jgi:hypothetical protein